MSVLCVTDLSGLPGGYTTRTILADYQRELASPFFQSVDDGNGFVNVSVASTAAAALNDLSKADPRLNSGGGGSPVAIGAVVELLHVHEGAACQSAPDRGPGLGLRGDIVI